MTWSAPIDRAVSTFLVLHTAVTSAPNALAICTANVPTPPDAPSTRTLWPGWIRPLSRRPCSAVLAAIGTAAASSNDRLAGFGPNFSSIAHTYSAILGKPLPFETCYPEHLVAWLKLPYVSANRFHSPGDITTEDLVFWCAQCRDHAVPRRAFH